MFISHTRLQLLHAHKPMDEHQIPYVQKFFGGYFGAGEKSSLYICYVIIEFLFFTRIGCFTFSTYKTFQCHLSVHTCIWNLKQSIYFLFFISLFASVVHFTLCTNCLLTFQMLGSKPVPPPPVDTVPLINDAPIPTQPIEVMCDEVAPGRSPTPPMHSPLAPNPALIDADDKPLFRSNDL